MGRVLINYKKAIDLVERVISAKEKIHKKILYPDAIIPKNIREASQEHRLFLFHSISIDSMRQAEKVYSAMRETTEKIGNLRKLAEIKKTELEELLIPYFGEGIVNPKNSMTNPVGTILYNAKKLEEEYRGDPEKIKDEKVWGTLKKIDKFKQYGTPKAALFMKNMVRFKMWPFNSCEIPIKVDRHVMRISLGGGIINTEEYEETPNWYGDIPKALSSARDQIIRIGYYTKEDFKEGKVRIVRSDKFVRPLTKTYIKITKKKNISAIDLDDLFWGIGAYSCKQNDSRYCYLYCPINCETRPPSDNNAVWFFLDIDKRKHKNHFFKD